MLRSNKEIPRRSTWPIAPDYAMNHLNRQKRTFDNFMPIPPILIQKYADPTDEAVISYCEEHGIDLQPHNEEEQGHNEEEQDDDEEDSESTSSEESSDGSDDNSGDEAVGSDGDSDGDDGDNGGNGADMDFADSVIRGGMLHQEDVEVTHVSEQEEEGESERTVSEGNTVGTSSTVPIDTNVANITVDELDVRAETASDHGLTGSMTLNQFLQNMNTRMEAEKQEQLLKAKAMLRGKGVMEFPEIPFDIPFRKPSGVVIREPSSQPRPVIQSPIRTSIHPRPAARPVIQPHVRPSIQPRPQTQPQVRPSIQSPVRHSVHVSSSSQQTLQDASITDLSEMLRARLLSISPPEQHNPDLISLLQTFQPTQPSTSSSVPNTQISSLISEFHSFRSEVQNGLKLMTDALTALSERVAKHEETCQAAAGSSLKRRHDHEDPDPQGHEGENAKRQRVETMLVEGSSDDVVQERREEERVEEIKSLVGDVIDMIVDAVLNYIDEAEEERLKEAHPELILEELINEVDITAMASQLNYVEPEDVNNLQLVIYVNPDSLPLTVEVPEFSNANESEDYEVMRNYFTNFIEIDSDDDEQTKFDKVWKIKEEDQDDIIVISDSEVEVGVDDKDLEEVELLYGDLLNDDIPRSSFPESDIPDVSIPEVPIHPVSPIAPSTQAPTTTAPQSNFEQGESSRANQEAPDFSGIPSSILRPGPGLTRQQRNHLLETHHRAFNMKSAFLEDSELNFFVKKRRNVSLFAILGVEKEQEWFQYEYYMFVKCQRQGKANSYSKHGIVRVLKIEMRNFVRIFYPVFFVERRDCNSYSFSEADLADLAIDDIEVMYRLFREMTVRPDDTLRAMDVLRRFIRRQIRFYRVFDFQLAIESHQPVVNVTRPDRTLLNINDLPLLTILEDPYGIVYQNQLRERLFLRFDEVGKYSDGTLKVIRLQVENKLKAALKTFLETRRRYQIDNPEIRLLRRVIESIDERLDFRRTLRRLEVLIGKNRQRTLFERH